MAGILTVDTIQSDSSYASTLNVASKVNFTSGMQIGGQDTTFGGMRNRIINGDMRIDQRNAGASVTILNSVTYDVDRWFGYSSTTSKFSLQQSSVAPVGFTNSLLATSLSAYSVTSSDEMNISQRIEGFNVADLGWGTANAVTVTLSFWVRSSLTGTFGGSLYNSGNSRSYPFSYTISAANTWEQKSITIAGDTSGTWLTTTGLGLGITICLGAGSTRSGTAGAWASANLASATGATSVVGTNGATFYITGVQLEKGSVASAFENRQYGTELALCQRYFYRPQQNSSTLNGGIGYAIATGLSTFARAQVPLPVTMRTVPTVAISNVHMYNPASGGGLVATFGDNYSTPDMVSFDGTSSGTTSPSGGSLLLYLNGSTGQLSATAEL